MSTDSKKKRGVSGAANAKAIPYRYVGGSHDSPLLDRMTRYALQCPAGDYRETATYASGIQGGVLCAVLGYEFPGWEEYLLRRQR